MATIYKTTEMTNVTAGPPATRLASNQHNRVHWAFGHYVATGAETTDDLIKVATLPLSAKVLPISWFEWDATVSGYASIGTSDDADKFLALTDVTSAGTAHFGNVLANMDWEADDDNTGVFITISGSLAVAADLYVGLAFMY